MPHTLGPARMALLSTTCPSLHAHRVNRQGQLPHCMWISSIDAADLNSPTLHVQLAPAEPLHMELSDYQQGGNQLPNTPGPLEPPRKIMLMETHTTSASHTGTSPHSPPIHYLFFTARRVNGPAINGVGSLQSKRLSKLT